MEDFTIVIQDVLGNNQYSFYCILDGHGGKEVAQYVAKSYPVLLQKKLQMYKSGYNIENIIKMTLDITQ